MKFSRYNLEINDSNSGKVILFNTLTGHSFHISKDIVSAIKNNNVSELDNDTVCSFKKCGIIIDDNVDERRYFTYYHGKSKFSSDAISSTILLTWACNFSCVYCYEGAGKKTESINSDSAQRYIKFMINEAETRRVKAMHVNLFGGEPLVNIEKGFYILKELKDYCEKNEINFSCGIITNGTLLTPEIMTELIGYNCSMIQITLDGMRETHNKRRPYKNGNGSFDDIISTLKQLVSYPNINIVIRINIDKINLSETESLLEYIGKKGEDLTRCSVDFGIVRGTTVACSSYSGNCLSENEIGDVLSNLWSIAEANGFNIHTKPYLRWMYCGLYNDSQFTITPDCGVYKCWEHAGIDEHKMGELDPNGKIINTTYAFYDWMSKNPLEDNDCSECVYLPACGGGCGVVSYNETGNYHSKGCFKVKGVLEKQIERFVQSLHNNN